MVSVWLSGCPLALSPTSGADGIPALARMGAPSPGWGLFMHPAGGGGELGLDPAKPSETRGLGLLNLGVTSMCVTQCQTLPQLWGGWGEELMECPRMGMGGPQGGGYSVQVMAVAAWKASVFHEAALARDTMGQPAGRREIWSPHAGWREGTVSRAQGDALP